MSFKKIIRAQIAPELIKLYQRKFREINSDKFEDISKVPRFVRTKFNINGTEIIVPDAASFLFMYKEIFDQEIYKFRSKNKEPYIIDCGANIGLASLYFNQLYPNANVVAFEPDHSIFKILKYNVRNIENIKIVNKGLWNETKEITFFSEGADAGLIDESKINIGKHESIQVEPLKSYLDRYVDFLKIDIEGAEFTVLKNISERLHFVQNIFVEYHSFVNTEQFLPELLEILRKAGFRLYVNSPGLSSPQPFHKINTYNNMDMQLNIYGIRSDFNNE